MLKYLYMGIMCSEKKNIFRERSVTKTVSFGEQIMSEDKISKHAFVPNGVYCAQFWQSGIVDNWRIVDIPLLHL